MRNSFAHRRGWMGQGPRFFLGLSTLVDRPPVDTPTVGMERQEQGVVLTWTGMLQASDSVTGPWYDYADDSHSPLPLTPEGVPTMFLRSRSYP